MPFSHLRPVVLALAFLAGALLPQAALAAPHWGSSRIVERDGVATFTVAGRPFFVWGAAFFYERLPRDRWRSSLEALRSFGINTLDLYVPWNWHETSDGDFDFSGRTNPRRDLREVIRLATSLGFRFVVRPGPVIRNEWRNGGYPSWLLERPEYGMPLHDILEGRYPATATLQNAHADEAAAEWMRNATHLQYARRWLEHALAEFAPVADRVLAIALDDDQGAYLDNDTYPGPNLYAYLAWLRETVAASAPSVPVFINTYQMKVTASSPVWAWGNWYQSDAYALGEHDRAQLEFSTALLGTRPHQPIMASEFQAGWLQAPEDALPRPADPFNTELALYSMLGNGAHGVINFPLQDTLNPAGWEAPFANAFYAWDSALRLDGERAPRALGTVQFATDVALYGAQLARSHRVADAAIAWPVSVPASPLSNAEIHGVADRVIGALKACRAAELACVLVDPRYAESTDLRTRPIIVPSFDASEGGLTRATIDLIARRGGTPRPLDDATIANLRRNRTVSGVVGSLLVAGRAPSAPAFLVVTNYGEDELRTTAVVRDPRDPATRLRIPVRLAGRHAVLLPIHLPSRVRDARVAARAGTNLPARGRLALSAYQGMPPLVPEAPDVPPSAAARAERVDAYRDGANTIRLFDNAFSLFVVPEAGGRAFSLSDGDASANLTTTVGAFRDDLEQQPPPSQTDRIAKYTHSFAAGTFNRPYAVTIANDRGSASVTLRYTAPDSIPAFTTFEKTLTLEDGARTLEVRRDVRYAAPPPEGQRLVSYDSLTVPPQGTQPLTLVGVERSPAPFEARKSYTLATTGFGVAREAGRCIFATWPAADVEDARVQTYDAHAVLRLRFAPGATRRTWYTAERCADIGAAHRRLIELAARAQGAVSDRTKSR